MTSTVWDRTSFSNYYVCYQGILGEFSVHILLAQYIRTMYAKKHKEDTESFFFIPQYIIETNMKSVAMEETLMMIK